MTPGARLAAAIEVLADHRGEAPPGRRGAQGLGPLHRFAGSGDRAAIAGLVYDALRRRASSAHIMGDQSPRAVAFGMLRLERKLDPAAIAALANGGRFAPPPLSVEEQARLDTPVSTALRLGRGDYPEWLDPQLAGVFGEERAAEGAALATRAPLDLRVNALKAEREVAAAALAHLDPVATRWSPHGLRIALAADARNPAIHAEPAFLKGLVEVQDEGSQLAALLSGARPGDQVIDLCAGAGGKTLALAAAMENRGQIYATDLDKRRLAPIHARLERAGVHNVQVRTPESQGEFARRPRRTSRPRVHRCALHRHRHLAPQPRCQMAGTSRCARSAARRAGRRARPSRASGEARRPHRLRHLLAARSGERRPGTRIPDAPSRFLAAAAGRPRRHARRARISVPSCGADLGGRPSDDARRTDTDGFYVSMLMRRS